jgi:hypothetical protein
MMASASQDKLIADLRGYLQTITLRPYDIAY